MLLHIIKRAVLSAGISCALSGCVNHAQQGHPDMSPLVQTEAGEISGKRLAEGGNAYLGIPYAAAPVGSRRWRAPEPAASWQGIRDATSYGASCMQAVQPEGQPPMNEDCLFLNVWTPGNAGAKSRLPVVVYLHGAGFNTGSASQAAFSGETLAQHDVILVNMNYRLGVMGGLALPALTASSPDHSSGNYQYLDQIAALRWVQRNIARFGGDPGNVMLMGQSSGAINVSILQASPLARGLFSKVLALSGAGVMHGGAWPGWTLSEAEQQGLRVQAATGAKSLEELRAMPAQEVISHAKFYFPVGAEGHVLPQHPAEIFAGGKQNDVPTFIGNTRDEGFSSIAKAQSVAQFQSDVRQMFGNQADRVLQLYPASSDAEVASVATRLANAGEFAKQMTQWARLQSATGKSPSYLFVFDGAQGPAPHGRDVAYWFGRMDQVDARRFVAPTAEDRRLSEKMVALLVAYARTGIPRTDAIDVPAYRRTAESVIELGNPIVSRPLDAGVDYFLDHPELIVGIGEPGLNPLKAK